ncbi:hypothetical protein CXU22_06980 [Akkermansia muciniphila]|uniref:Uncharacterized protein n=1 Tax=Akkermansia muciniphila TaxID=239935 RepID=A0A2N8HC93_9BACT|nr:hypothetical protein CXU22_06980 [Akkermansia muciniphila]
MFFYGKDIVFHGTCRRAFRETRKRLLPQNCPDQSVGAPCHLWKSRDDGRGKESEAGKNIHDSRRI